MTEQAEQPIRVLLVDDHRSVLWGLERLIESDRPRMQTVGKVTSASEALACADKLLPDVILLDIDLGRESGIDAIPQLLDRTRAKVLVLTGVRDSALQDKAMLAGASGVIGKEQQPDDILKAIAKVHAGEIWLDRLSTGRVFKLAQRGDSGADDTERKKLESLTAREAEIVRAVADQAGATTKTIAEALNISDRTLRNHLTSIYEKLGLANRLELFVYASKHGYSRQSKSDYAR
jgi:two-component system, NarL family, nitrate/nitrite response regulator NarL